MSDTVQALARALLAVIFIVSGFNKLIAIGGFWAALALAAFTAIALVLAHKFWAVPPDQYQNQLNHALKNLAMIGGFLLLYANGPGRMSVDANRS